jgi:arylsulfatase
MPKEKRNTLDDHYTLNVDLAPTILGAAGLTAPPGMQGSDISLLYRQPGGKESWREEFYYEFPVDMGLTMPMSSALVRKDFKYIYWPQFKEEQLFHLKTDPLEKEDIVKNVKYAKILDEMRLRHDELQKSVV